MYDGNPGEIDFGSSYREVRVSEGSSYRESTVLLGVINTNGLLHCQKTFSPRKMHNVQKNAD